MTDTRITRARRIFVEYIGSLGETTFSHLKANLVGKGEGKMDNTTLYRMIDTFKKQGLIHEVENNGERHIFLAGADYAPGYDAVTFSICENCGNIQTIYTPLPDHILESNTINRVEICEKCPT